MYYNRWKWRFIHKHKKCKHYLGNNRKAQVEYKRAIDTVKEFADANILKIGIVEDFRERKIDSKWIEDFTDFSKKQWEDFDYKLSDGESLSEVQSRNIAALNQVLIDYEDKNIVIASHGTALSTIINYFDPSFGHSNFEEIRTVMPWIVKFTFEGDQLMDMDLAR